MTSHLITNLLVKIKSLLLMYIYELNDILFFIKSCKSPSPHFNIHHYITFSNFATRSSEHSKLLHIKCFSNNSRHFYFCRIPRLWNAFPHITVNLPLPTIKKKLYILWHHFISNYDSCHVHAYLPFLLSLFQMHCNPQTSYI